MSTRIKLILTSVLLFHLFASQAQLLPSGIRLPKKLNEISGLVKLNDSLLVAHNDGGDDPRLFLIDTLGNIRKKIFISGAENHDWEAITMDEKRFLWIGDIGNNYNQRQNLSLYRLSADSLLLSDTVQAQKYAFAYPDQVLFPPADTSKYYDCEAIAAFQGAIYLFTKCRTEPYSGISRCYRFDPEKESHQLEWIADIALRSRSFRKDAVTDACVWKDTCYLLTYSGIEVFIFAGGRFRAIARKKFGRWTQKEALTVDRNGLWMADEYLRGVGGGRLYRLKK